MNQRFILFTYTDGLGDIPSHVKEFMNQHADFCEGVVVSGNSNFGHHVFGGAGEKIAQLYQVPLICKMDLRGTMQDDEKIKAFYYEKFQLEEAHDEAVFEIK